MDKFQLIEESVKLGLGELSQDGALLVNTGKHTGRSAAHRYLAKLPIIENEIAWGANNQPIDPKVVKGAIEKAELKLSSEKIYTYSGFVGCFPVKVTSTSPWHIAFAANMFRQSQVKGLSDAVTNPPKMTILHDPYGNALDYDIGAPSETFIGVDPTEMKVVIIGTAYAGEIKKSAFGLANFWLPTQEILPMHASANCKEDGTNTCVLFGLSGTGKTTLSADPTRHLIGDDEIIWGPTGLSNLEGGCYAKLINLDESKEPEIFKAANRKGSILENLVYNEDSKKIDFFDDSITENTRGSYGLEAMSKLFDQSKEAAPPDNIIFLVADAFGAMPAVAQLNDEQAEYHFISGYTAKVAGTEIGIKEPKAVFSACFGAPFMPRPASVYAKLLTQLAKKYKTNIWLLNTGWINGYEKGERFPISISRTLVSAIQSGELAKQEMQTHPVFGFKVPVSCPGVEAKYLQIPSGNHVEDLADRFDSNIDKCAPGLKIKRAQAAQH